MNMRPRAFKVRTYDDSWFMVRFHPVGFHHGVLCGNMLVVGFSKVMEEPVEWEGLGAIPMEGGRIVVSAAPIYIEVINGLECPIYETETIAQVKEIEVPDDLIDLPE